MIIFIKFKIPYTVIVISNEEVVCITDKVLEELESIKKLLILQLRYSEVPAEVIGKVIRTNAKTIRNQYPLKKSK